MQFNTSMPIHLLKVRRVFLCSIRGVIHIPPYIVASLLLLCLGQLPRQGFNIARHVHFPCNNGITGAEHAGAAILVSRISMTSIVSSRYCTEQLENLFKIGGCPI